MADTLLHQILPRWSTPAHADRYADALHELHGDPDARLGWVEECNAWSELTHRRLSPRGNGVDLLLASLALLSP